MKIPKLAGSDRWGFPLNEKFCALRTANALQSHRNAPGNESAGQRQLEAKAELLQNKKSPHKWEGPAVTIELLPAEYEK